MRKIINEKEMMEMFGRLPADINHLDFARIDYKDQIQALASSQIFIGSYLFQTNYD